MGEGILMLIVLVLIYFIPSIIVCNNDHKNLEGVMILNLFLGWTFIGWVIALIWAVSNNEETSINRGIK